MGTRSAPGATPPFVGAGQIGGSDGLAGKMLGASVVEARLEVVEAQAGQELELLGQAISSWR